MILFGKVRKVLLSIGMAFFISITIVFSLASGESWAATLFTQGINQPQAQIATMNQAQEMMNNVKDKAQEMMTNMTNEPTTEVIQNDQQLDANTQEGILDSIKNPNYNPGGKSKEAENQDRQAIKGIEADVRDLFNPEPIN